MVGFCCNPITLLQFEQTGRVVTRWGGADRTAPGNFVAPHDVAIDSRVNLHPTEGEMLPDAVAAVTRVVSEDEDAPAATVPDATAAEVPGEAAPADDGATTEEAGETEE